MPTNEIDAYIAQFPEETQRLLEQIRATIRATAPEAEEVISYAMPGYRFHGMLVWFAVYKKHIGFYPGAAGIERFKEQLSGYKGAKGSVQFPLNQPLPLKLIAEIVAFRVRENLARAEAKKK